MTIADLVIKIRADSAAAEKSLSGFGAKMGSGIRKAAIPAAAALAGLGVVGKIAFDNLQDGARNAKQTETVIKSTGGAANVTAKHVDDLAMSLRRKAGVDDYVVHSGENMLLTFTNIQNRVGKGNDIFDQATKVMLDMSHALGQDTKSSAIQLGKALNDPIKGVTALQRVGVSFTADQRKQIKALVDSGHSMEAQKLILHELNKEFGGSATNIDPTTKALGNLKLDAVDLASSLISGLLPAFQTLIGYAGQAATWLQKHEQVAKILGITLFGLAAAIMVVNAAMAVFAVVTSPITAVLLLLAALGVAVYLAWTRSEQFRDVVTAAFNAIKAVAEVVLGWLVANVPAIWATIQADTVAVWNAIVGIVTGVWARIRGVVMTALGAVKALVMADLQIIKGIIDVVMGLIHGDWSRVWNGIKELTAGILNGIVALIRGTIGIAQQAARALGDAILDGIISVLKTIASKVTSALSALWGALKGMVGRALAAGAEIGRAIVDGIANGIKGAVGHALSAVENAGGSILSHAKGFFHINSPSLLMAREIGSPIMEGIAKGMKDNSDMMLQPFKEAKFAVDAWANTKGVDNFKGLGESMAGALRGGFVGGFKTPGGPLAAGIANATFGNDGLDAPFANAIANGSLTDLGHGTGDVYLDGRKVGTILRRGLNETSRDVGGLGLG